jgi:hypothetical protein
MKMDYSEKIAYRGGIARGISADLAAEFLDAQWYDMGDPEQPPTPPVLTPFVPVNLASTADLKRFVYNTGRYGYLPTRQFADWVNNRASIQSVSELQAT